MIGNPKSRLLLISIALSSMAAAAADCRKGCDLALASYYITDNVNLTYIASLFGESSNRIASFNNLANADYLLTGDRIRVPFRCDCLAGGKFLGGNLTYTTVKGDTYETIASEVYQNLTTSDWMQSTNSYTATRILDGASVNVIVNCSCGDASLSKEYGLFLTYPLGSGETLRSAANESGFVDLELLPKYNPGKNLSDASGLVFIPAKGISGGAIAGIVIAALVAIVGLAYCLYVGASRRRAKKASLLQPTNMYPLQLGPAEGALPGYVDITVDKSVEFSYEELARATDNFSSEYKIGEGGFGAVYYAERRGEKAAIKKMDMQATREFLAELKVLTRIHHLNLVADFGLAKLTEVGSASLLTRLVGTFGYMPPEYAQYGVVSPKVDVYAFGVVLYELISAKKAVVKTNGSIAESKGLVALMAQLAKACTQENSQLRPSMRSIVVALMTLPSTTEDWDVGSFYEKQALVNLMPGR
ncbi:Chitin elicitor receptor kinase 1 [Acorus calamus]|uniref:Chitin elicitor receptor kinase 1 n=1 Tax=Acorus calamus TaxID=4465 RepID=A0AAV9D5C7_ACOCL|nr:Chitin elicitor receptor kinase 1 [Acorus calamus]